MPTAGAELGKIDPDPDPRRHLKPGRKRNQQVAADNASRSAMASAGGTTSASRESSSPVGVAHGDGGDEITVEQSGAGERQAIASDDRALTRLREGR